MGVENSYFIADWLELEHGFRKARSPEIFAEETFAECPAWLRRYEFADTDVDPYLYQSWNGVIAIDAYLKKVFHQIPLQPREFEEVVSALGLWMDQNDKFTPIQALTDREEEFVFCAIPPDDVARLLTLAKRINISSLQEQVSKVIRETPANTLRVSESDDFPADVFRKQLGFSKYVAGLVTLLQFANAQSGGIFVIAS